MSIKIFQKEINDGIGDLVKSTASVAYCSPASLHVGTKQAFIDIARNDDILNKVLAENKDQIDLFYLEAVLVSTGWNKNDDVFTTQPTWEARKTPEDKQFNFMHDENDIIGHITGSYVLTKDGKAIADDDIAPEDFDIITQAVLYNSWTNPENKERMEKIIAEIEEGKWYVSMECLFSGFDYAMIDTNGNAKILARDEESSFLTKHLRAYGGTGGYEGYKLGRALSGISFSGKGLVSKPANPRSVIFNSTSANVINFTDKGNKFSIGEINMSDSLVEKQLFELREQLAQAKAENEAIKAKIEEAKDKEFASKIESFKTAAEQTQATIEQLNEVIKSTQAKVAELEDALAQSNEQLAAAKMSVEEMKKKEKMQKRMAALIEAGFDQEDVEATLAAFDALDDGSFDSVVAMYGKKKASEKMMEDEKMKKEKEAKAQEVTEVKPDAFDKVQTSEATLVLPEQNELESTRASVANWFEQHVLNK
jgi:hypothetical protein